VCLPPIRDHAVANVLRIAEGRGAARMAIGATAAAPHSVARHVERAGARVSRRQIRGDAFPDDLLAHLGIGGVGRSELDVRLRRQNPRDRRSIRRYRSTTFRACAMRASEDAPGFCRSHARSWLAAVADLRQKTGGKGSKPEGR
jgi:hypothetical protein